MFRGGSSGRAAAAPRSEVGHCRSRDLVAAAATEQKRGLTRSAGDSPFRNTSWRNPLVLSSRMQPARSYLRSAWRPVHREPRLRHSGSVDVSRATGALAWRSAVAFQKRVRARRSL
jgi:hypothetical protein